jgi:hypothetical protein
VDPRFGFCAHPCWPRDRTAARHNLQAFAEERDRKELVLFPVRVDDAVMETPEPWARKLRDQRNVGDFRRWKDHDAYKQSFARVVSDLT